MPFLDNKGLAKQHRLLYRHLGPEGKGDADAAKLAGRRKAIGEAAGKAESELARLEGLAKIAEGEASTQYRAARANLMEVQRQSSSMTTSAEDLERFEQYVTTLMKGKLFKNFTKEDPLFKELFSVVPDPESALRLAVVVRKMSRRSLNAYSVRASVQYLKKYGDVQGVIGILQMLMKRNVLPYATHRVLLSPDVKSLDEVAAFCETFKSLRCPPCDFEEAFLMLGINPSPVLTGGIKELRAAGIKDFYFVRSFYDQYKGDPAEVSQRVRDLYNRKLSLNGIIYVLHNFDKFDDGPDELANYISKLAALGIGENLALYFFKEKVPIERAIELKPLSASLYYPSEYAGLLKDETLDVPAFARFTHALRKADRLLSVDVIVSWWNVNRNADEAVAYNRGVGEIFSGRISPLEMYKAQPSLEKLQSHKAYILAVKDKWGIDVVNAAFFVFHSPIAEKTADQQEELMEKFPEGTTLPQVAILMQLVDGGTEEEKTAKAIALYSRAGERTGGRPPILFRGLAKALEFISTLKGAGIDTEGIIAAAPQFYSAEDVLTAYNFQKKYNFPIKREKTVAISRSGAPDVEVSGGIGVAALYCGDDPAKAALLKEVFERSAMVSADNVHEYLKDPALGFCEQVYRKIGDVELAMMIGRNLFASGVSKKVLDALSSEELMLSYYKILELREKYGEIPLYEDRRVVVLRHGEKWAPTYQDELGDHATPSELVGKDRFFDKKDQEALLASMGEGAEARLEAIGPSDDKPSLSELMQIKRRMIDAMVNTKPRLLFCLPAMGRPSVCIIPMVK